MKNFIVTPAPHAHSGDSVRRNMLLVILALLPAYVVSVIEFGYGALITAAISVLACVGTEWLISRFLLKEKKQTIGDLSAVLTGLLLAFNLPSNIDWWIVLIGAVVAIGIGTHVSDDDDSNHKGSSACCFYFLTISMHCS